MDRKQEEDDEEKEGDEEKKIKKIDLFWIMPVSCVNNRNGH